MAPNHYRKLYRQAFPVILADCKEQTQSQALYPHYFPFIRLKSAPRKLRGRPAVRLRIAPVPPHPLNFTSPGVLAAKSSVSGDRAGLAFNYTRLHILR